MGKSDYCRGCVHIVSAVVVFFIGFKCILLLLVIYFVHQAEGGSVKCSLKFGSVDPVINKSKKKT